MKGKLCKFCKRKHSIPCTLYPLQRSTYACWNMNWIYAVESLTDKEKCKKEMEVNQHICNLKETV